MARRCLSIALGLVALTAWGRPVAAGEGGPFELVGLPAPVGQVVRVETPDWEATSGLLTLWERTDRTWEARGAPIEVVVGRAGMGWGLGRFTRQQARGPFKREGDGRSPAGIFGLGPAYGYADRPPAGGAGFEYRQATAADLFVDDPLSEDYNTWVRATDGQPGNRWRSFERMRRDDALYELGVVVHHNAPRPVPGAGSAIFLHVWRGPGTSTAGCTAMRRADMEAVIRWLDPRRSPVLVQGPAGALPAVRHSVVSAPGQVR